MEKIKNILKPGAAQDDELLYGSGKSSGQAHSGLSGEGSHFAQAKSMDTNPDITSSTTDPALTHTSHDIDSTPNLSKMPGTYPTQTQTETGSGNPYTAKDVDPRLGGTGERGTAGLGSTSATDSSRTGAGTTLGEQDPNVSASTTAGPHDSKLLNKMDPRVGSNLDNSRADGTNTTGHHYARDAGVAGGAAVLGEGVHHHEKEHKNLENTGYAGTTPSGVGSSYYPGPAGVGLSGTQSSTATDTAPTNTPHVARDAAVGAGGVGLAEHERKKDNAYNSGLGSGSGAPGEASEYVSNQFGSGSSDHHYGRDVAVGGAGLAGSAAVGKHEYNKKEAENAAVLATTSDTNTGLAPDTSGLHSGDHYARDYLKTEGDFNTPPGSAAQPTVAREKDHHLGRDAAAGGAGLAAAGAVGKHEHDKRADKSATTTSSTTVPGTTSGPAPNTSGPHKQDWMNKLDPRVDHNAGLDKSTESKALSSDTSTKDHHYGRDAAGLGAAGVGAHEISKHHKEREIEKGQGSSGIGSSGIGSSGIGSSGIGSSGIGSSGIGSSGIDNSQSSSAVPSQSAATSHTHDHHLGTDAAGLGAAGVGAHEVSKHHKEKELEKDQLASTTSTTGSSDHHYGRDATALGGAAAVGEHEHHKHHGQGHGTTGATGTAVDPLARNDLPPGNDYGKNIQDPRYGMPMEGAPHNIAGESVGQDRGLGATGTSQATKDHHYGRDAAAGGVVGAGAYEAEKHHKHDKDLTAAEKEEKREHKHQLKEEKKHQHDLKEEKKHQQEPKEEKKHSSGGLLSFLHRDKNKKYTQEEEDEFDRQEREHKSHLGRDAAGGAAIGGAAYEAEKHHRDHNTGISGTSATAGDTMKPLPTTPAHQGIGTGAGTQGYGTETGTHGITTGAGTQGFGTGADIQGFGTGAASQSFGTGADTQGFGTGAGTQDGLADRNRTTGISQHDQIPTSSSTGPDHHYGRDAAIVGGVGGTAALAEHEHHKHGESGTTGGLTTGDKLHGMDRGEELGTTGGLTTGERLHGLGRTQDVGTTGLTTGEKLEGVDRSQESGTTGGLTTGERLQGVDGGEAGTTGGLPTIDQLRGVNRNQVDTTQFRPVTGGTSIGHGYGTTTRDGITTAEGTTTDPGTGFPIGGTGSASLSGIERMERTLRNLE